MKHKLTAYAYDRKGRLIAKAHNNYSKSHPIQAHFASLVGQPEKVFLHAEIAALLQAGKTHVERLHIERFHKDGTPALARPCLVCQKAIEAYGVKQISFTGM